MPLFLESFAAIGFLAFFIASSVVGVRLLLLWRRTRELPELLIGLGVLGIGPVGFGFIVVGELCVPGAPGLAQILIGSGLAAMSVGCGATCVFNRRVFHPRNRVVGALVVVICLMLTACLVWEYSNTGFRTLVNPGNSHFLRIGILVGCVLWCSTEALRYWNRMRRRVRLSLADPVVANRFLLWGVGAGTAGFASVVVGFMQWWTGLHPIQMPRVLLFASVFGFASSIALWLAFVPSGRYMRWIQARSAA